jgi:hypothetical protein
LFIFYDDVQYDKHGWRNRNQIKTARGKQWLTVPVHTKGVTGGIPIKNVRIDWSRPWSKSHLKALTSTYQKAPYFKDYLPLLEAFYNRREECLADFTIGTTILLSRELGIASTQFLRSSELPGTQGARTERLIHILEQVGATRYLSGPSARDYIEREKFDEAGIRLEYMDYSYPKYPQLYPPFDPYVTILDLLFMTGKDAIDYL